MKVVCISNTLNNATLFELHQVYDTIEMNERHFGYPKFDDYYLFYSNNHKFNEIWSKKFNFVTLDEWRQQQIEKIL
jgi:hypothetical protein